MEGLNERMPGAVTELDSIFLSFLGCYKFLESKF